MFERRIPEWLRHAPTPGVRGFAVLNGCEALARGMLISVMPLVIYEAVGSAQHVSAVYFFIGAISLVVNILVPWAAKFVRRSVLYLFGCLLFLAGLALAGFGTGHVPVLGLGLVTVATVMIFVNYYAYIMDFIAKHEMGRCESSRLFYAAFGWAVGPALGVSLRSWWAPAPFVISGLAIVAMMAIFLYLRMGNGKLITRAVRPSPNPLAYLSRFLAQPRLVAGWLFAVIRSVGWWVYIVYLPIFSIESGFPPELGGWLLSLTNAMLFLAPLFARWMQRRSVRHAVRTGFLVSGLLFAGAASLAPWPAMALTCLVTGSFFLILLDVSAGLTFLLAVKPSERTEMSAVYASFRDVSGILTPAAAWVILMVAPLPGIFAAGGLALVWNWWVARHLHPRLGRARMAVERMPRLSGPQLRSKAA